MFFVFSIRMSKHVNFMVHHSFCVPEGKRMGKSSISYHQALETSIGHYFWGFLHEHSGEWVKYALPTSRWRKFPVTMNSCCTPLIDKVSIMYSTPLEFWIFGFISKYSKYTNLHTRQGNKTKAAKTRPIIILPPSLSFHKKMDNSFKSHIFLGSRKPRSIHLRGGIEPRFLLWVLTYSHP